MRTLFLRLPLFVLFAVLLGSPGQAAETLSAARAQVAPMGEDLSTFTVRMQSASPQQKAEYVAQAIEEMEQILDTMLDMVKKSPECVETRIVLLNTLIDTVLIVQTDMLRAQAEGNRSRADLELRKVAVALSVARTLLAEALDCAAKGSSPGVSDSWTSYAGPDLADAADADEFEFDDDDPPEISPFQ